MRNKLNIRFYATTEYGGQFLVNDLKGNDLGLYKWFTKDYNSSLWHIREFTTVSANLDNENMIIRNIRFIKS